MANSLLNIRAGSKGGLTSPDRPSEHVHGLLCAPRQICPYSKAARGKIEVERVAEG